MPRWDDIKGDLFEAVYTVLKPSLNKDEQDAIVNFMKARGHDMTWIAIRYAFIYPRALFSYYHILEHDHVSLSI